MEVSNLAVAVVVVVILVLLWLVYKPTIAPAPAPAAPQLGEKYQSLLATLDATPKWAFFDPKSKSRKFLTIKINGGVLQVGVEGAGAPTPLKYGPDPAASDGMLATDPNIPTYELRLKYISPKSLMMQEKQNNMVIFEDQIGA